MNWVVHALHTMFHLSYLSLLFAALDCRSYFFYQPFSIMLLGYTSKVFVFCIIFPFLPLLGVLIPLQVKVPVRANESVELSLFLSECCESLDILLGELDNLEVLFDSSRGDGLGESWSCENGRKDRKQEMR